MRFLIVLLLLVLQGCASRQPDAPEGVYLAGRACAERIYRRRDACLPGSQAALTSWESQGRRGSVLVYPPTPYSKGHAIAYLADSEDLDGPGWVIDPVGSAMLPSDQYRMFHAPSPSVAVERSKNLPSRGARRADWMPSFQ